MAELGKVLVVDDSRLMIEVFKESLQPHCLDVITATTMRDAVACVRKHTDLQMVLTDVYLGDGTGLDVLQAVRDLDPPRPHVFLCTARPDDFHRARASELRAAGFLTKPLSLRTLLQEWNRLRRENEARARSFRHRVLANVFVLDPENHKDRLIGYEVHDMSDTGAFLVTTGPMPLGMKLPLAIDADGTSVRVNAVVVRIQEPSWTKTGGIGVRFDDPTPETRAMLADMMTRLTIDR